MPSSHGLKSRTHLGYCALITCIIARSNPRRLLPIWREKLRCHYYVTMTSDNDFCVWRWHYRERHSSVSVNAQTIACNAPHIRALITSRNDHHVWTDRNSFTGMSTEMIKSMLFSLCFCQKIHLKTHKIVKVAVIMTTITLHHLFSVLLWIRWWLFWSSVFFWGSAPRYFSLGAALPQKNTSAQNNHLQFSHNDLKKDGAQLLLSN